MKNKKVISLLLAGMMLVSTAACGKTSVEEPAVSDSTAATSTTTAAEGTGDAEEAAAPADIDLTDQVNLVFYVMGDAPIDEEAVEAALNEKLLEKANATIDFQFATWTDFQQKYSLELTSGQADMVYVANWLNYGQLATSGAFLELDDLLTQYAPDLKALAGEENLKMCSVNGSVYSVPTCWPEYTCSGIKYREDLREQYDLPVPDSVEHAEEYFLGIQKNMPNQGILTVTAEESQGLQVAFDAFQIFNLKYPWVTVNGLPYGIGSNYDAPEDLYDYWFSDDFADDCKVMKKWADYGFWSKSALSDTNNSDSYKSGLCVAEYAGQNPNKQITALQDFKTAGKDWKSEFLTYGEVTNTVYPGHATQNGTAILRECKNPERAMYVLQLLMCDKEINDLVEYGIEGVNYEVTADGVYKNLVETDPKPFPYEGFNTWNLRNSNFKLPQETDVELNKMAEKYSKLAENTKFPNVNIYGGFAENYDAYAAERTAVSNVMRQYLAPLQAGLVDDVDAAVEEFRTKVTDAGLETCREGFKEQWLAYCDEYGYK